MQVGAKNEGLICTECCRCMYKMLYLLVWHHLVHTSATFCRAI